MTQLIIPTSKQIAALEEQAINGKPSCLILARKYSKRLKNKCKLPLNGKPLAQYSIDAAKSSGLFENVIVSSDDMCILEMAYDSNCLVHQRPDGLSGPKVQMKTVVRFLAEIYNLGDCSCVLTPCNPFVTPEDLKAGYKLFQDNKANYVMSVKLAKPHPINCMDLIGGCMRPRPNIKRSQDYEPMYHSDGGFIFFKPEALQNEFDYGFYGTRNFPYITPHWSVDIDTSEDFRLAEILMEVENGKGTPV